MNTEIANAVNAAGNKAQYDERVKRLLSHKVILANILIKTVAEFKDMNPKDVVSYIEGEPQVGIVPIEPGLTNAEQKDETVQRIVGINSENSEINEGLIRFDIIFYVRMKNGLSQIIVNIECQKVEPSAYKILNLAIFYVSRLISSQKERDFVNTNYDDIKQVFSIWICMNMAYNSLSHIHLVKNEILTPYNWKGNLDLINIVMVGITSDVPAYDENHEMHRLISSLLSEELKEHEKLNILKYEYNIPITNEFGEEVKVMCNLSEGIEERAIEKVIIKMHENNFSLEQISLATDKSIDEIDKIIKENELVFA